MPDAYSFIKTDSDHVVLYALKQMEGFYDTRRHRALCGKRRPRGRRDDSNFRVDVRATETTELEDVQRGTDGEGSTIHFHMKPWEIKTLRLSKVKVYLAGISAVYGFRLRVRPEFAWRIPGLDIGPIVGYYVAL